MGLLDLLRRKGVPRRWSFTFAGAIWRLQPTVDGTLIGEVRDVQHRRLTLFALHPLQGQLLWTGQSFDEPWWIALESTIGDVAVLHRYPRPDRPETSGCLIIDTATGTVLWEDPMGRVVAGDEATLLLQRGEPSNWADTVIVDAMTGSVIKQLDGTLEEVESYRAHCGRDARWDGWMSVHELDPDEGPWKRELSSLGVDTRTTVVGPIESIECGDWNATVVHTSNKRTGEGIRSMLYLRRGPKVVVRELLRLESTPPPGDSFFVWNSILVAVSGRETILGIDLRVA